MDNQPFQMLVEFTVRKLVRRCIENEKFENDPVAVLTNEQDKLLDELNDGVDRSRKPGGEMVEQAQDPTSKDERRWTKRVAGSFDMPSELPAVARVQKKRREVTKITGI